MLLAVDTSTKKMGLALYDGVQVPGELLWQSRHHHTVELAPAVVRLLHSSGLKMDDIQALGIAIGPGSFTSLRVGLSFIKGLAMTRHIPVIGIPSLDVQAASVEAGNYPLVAVLQAGRGRLAVGWYNASKNGWQPEGSAIVTTADELANRIGVSADQVFWRNWPGSAGRPGIVMMWPRWHRSIYMPVIPFRNEHPDPKNDGGGHPRRAST